MSSTSVHSNESEFCVAGQTIADGEGNITIPPTAAKEGPTVEDVRNGMSMEIEAHDGELREDGKLTQNGKVIKDFGVKAYNEIKGIEENKESNTSREEGR